MNASGNSVGSGPGSQVNPAPFMSQPGRCQLLQEWVVPVQSCLKCSKAWAVAPRRLWASVPPETFVLCSRLTVCLSCVPSIPSHSGFSAGLGSWRLTLKICPTQAELSFSLQAGMVAGHNGRQGAGRETIRAYPLRVLSDNS